MVPGVVGSSPISHPRQSRGSGSPRSPISFHIGASPSGKARDFDSLIRWFESSRPSQIIRAGQRRFIKDHDPVAQSAEQLPFKQWVRGSNPRRVTTSSRTSYRSRRLFLQKVIAHSLRRSSFPNRNRCAGLRFGFGSGTESLHLESVHAFHVGASCISLAPTFFKSQSALIPLLLLSTREPQRSRWRLCRLTDTACPLRVLRWVRGWFGCGTSYNNRLFLLHLRNRNRRFGFFYSFRRAFTRAVLLSVCSSFILTMRAGLPATTAFSGTSSMTTAPAATTAPRPM